MDLILRCIDNDPQRRPQSRDIVPRLSDMVLQNPLSLNVLEMLQQIDTDNGLKKEKEELQQQIAELRADKSRQQGIEHGM